MAAECYDQIRLDGIWSNAERSKGLARQAMKILLESADKYRVRIRLIPERLIYNYEDINLSETEKARRIELDAHALTTQQLYRWYLRLGFDDDGVSFGEDDYGGLLLYVPRMRDAHFGAAKIDGLAAA